MEQNKVETYSTVETVNSTHFSAVRRPNDNSAFENPAVEGLMPEYPLTPVNSFASDYVEPSSVPLDGCTTATPSWSAFAGHPYTLNVMYMGGEFMIEMEREGVRLTEPLRYRELEFVHLYGSEYTARFIGLLLKSPRALQFVDRVLHRLRKNVYATDFVAGYKSFVRNAFLHLSREVTDKGTWSFDDLVRAVDDAVKIGFFEYSPQSCIPYDEQCTWEIFLQAGTAAKEDARRKHRAIFDVREIIPQIQQRELTSRQLNRLRREAIQRQTQLNKAEAERKSVPKEKRERSRKSQQSAALRAKTLIEEQSGWSSVNWKKLSHQDRMKMVEVQPQGLGQVVKFPFRLVKNIVCLVPRLSKALEHLCHLLDPNNKDSKLNKALESSSNVMDQIHETIKQVRNTFRHHLPKLLLQAIIGGFVWYIFKKFDSVLLRLSMAALAGVIFGPSIKSLLDEVFQEESKGSTAEPVIETQSGDDSSLFAKIIGTVILGTVVGTKKVAGLGGLLMQLIKVISMAPRAIKGIDCMVDAVVHMTEAGVNFIRMKFNMSPIKFRNQWAKLIGDLAVRVRSFEFDIDSGKCTLSSPKYTLSVWGS